MGTALGWDLFCRVVDNHGDLGVCWRLARGLAGLGHTVRLWVDDSTALAWMAPTPVPGVTVLSWTDPPPPAVADVVVEAFGCDPPPAFVDVMARTPQAPVWINLEYLSAEDWVQRAHGLPSPTRHGLTKWFFFPGFSPCTGGLLRDEAWLQQRAGFDGQAWLAQRGWHVKAGERVASLFCYQQPQLDWLLGALSDRPTVVLATPGHATEQLRQRILPSNLRVLPLPWLTQPDYDRLLWSCDLNAVRGEDSVVQALWAGAPLLWQIYPQDDGVHAAKLQAFVDLYAARMPAALAHSVRQALWHWNGLGQAPAAGAGPALPDLAAWGAAHAAFASDLMTLPDLVTQLCRFVQGKRQHAALAC